MRDDKDGGGSQLPSSAVWVHGSTGAAARLLCRLHPRASSRGRGVESWHQLGGEGGGGTSSNAAHL